MDRKIASRDATGNTKQQRRYLTVVYYKGNILGHGHRRLTITGAARLLRSTRDIYFIQQYDDGYDSDSCAVYRCVAEHGNRYDC